MVYCRSAAGHGLRRARRSCGRWSMMDGSDPSRPGPAGPRRLCRLRRTCGQPVLDQAQAGVRVRVRVRLETPAPTPHPYLLQAKRQPECAGTPPGPTARARRAVAAGAGCRARPVPGTGAGSGRGPPRQFAPWRMQPPSLCRAEATGLGTVSVFITSPPSQLRTHKPQSQPGAPPPRPDQRSGGTGWEGAGGGEGTGWSEPGGHGPTGPGPAQPGTAEPAARRD